MSEAGSNAGRAVEAVNTFLSWFTVERTSGLIMLLTGALLIPRPFASALQALQDAYRIDLTLSLLTAALFGFGLYLVWRRTVGRLVFVALLSPMWLYGLALFLVFGFSYTIGPFGFIFGLWACGLSIYIHSLREPPISPKEPPPETTT